MDNEKKKEMFEAYKKKDIVGGVYCIECSGNHKKTIKSTRDLDSIKNRFDFGISINSCPEPSMRASWDEFGKDSFVFSVLESLKKGKEQTDGEYLDDLSALLKMCKENQQK